ncbi:MAG TPA: DUF1573 domain-containing protein [Thermoanaerobaculia bacterium]|nr:DUF1573 domain-containing protein [Thermoanaerobaculia bacterium]
MVQKRMIWMLAILLTLAIAGAAWAQQAGEAAAARLTLVDPLKDFGTVPKGTKLEWNFTIRNTGQANLEILSVQPACGCTVAEFDKVIEPGSTGKIHAVVDTAQFSGPISKGISVTTNDPTTPNAQLTMRAVVKPYVEAFPAGFLRYMLLHGQAETQSTILYSEEDKPFEIVDIEVPGEHVKVEYAKVENEEDRARAGRDGQNQYRLNVTVGGPEARIGPIADKIRVVTNSDHQPEYFISLTGLIRPSYIVNPSVLNFGDVSTADPAATRTVMLRTNNRAAPDQFKVTRVESSVPAVVAEAKASADPGSYEVTVRLDRAAKAGVIDGNVMIYTTDPYNPVYTLPIRGSIKG